MQIFAAMVKVFVQYYFWTVFYRPIQTGQQLVVRKILTKKPAPIQFVPNCCKVAQISYSFNSRLIVFCLLCFIPTGFLWFIVSSLSCCLTQKFAKCWQLKDCADNRRAVRVIRNHLSAKHCTRSDGNCFSNHCLWHRLQGQLAFNDAESCIWLPDKSNESHRTSKSAVN